MAKFDYDVYEAQSSKASTSNGFQKAKVGYFSSLKNDGEEAVVRFAYSSPSEFDCVSVHKVNIDGKFRNISCLRGYKDPTELCPICAKGEVSVSNRFFVKLIEYVKDEQGNVIANPVIWERTIYFAKTLKAYFEEYGDLKECVFKIKRHGAKGDKNTTYDIIFANPMIYKAEIYKKDFSAFENLDLSHHSYINKDYNELKTFVETGSFGTSNTSQPITKTISEEDIPFDVAPQNGANRTYATYEEVKNEGTTPQPTTPSNDGYVRPRRTYDYN